MSSLDMVAFINSTREPGKAELQHRDFTRKVPDVLGLGAEIFAGTSTYVNGMGGTQTRAIYNFPRREAMLMAMSYSYKLQATVYDAWEAAEATQTRRAKHWHSPIPAAHVA